MLSAIAARKAAQAAKLSPASQTLPSAPRDEASSEQESEAESDRPKPVLRSHNTKRRSGATFERPSVRNKRRKKAAKAGIAQNRYFDTAGAGATAETAGYAYEDTPGSSSDSDENIQEVSLVDDKDIEDIVEAHRSREPRRGWSPSRLAQDSFNDELDSSALNPLLHTRSRDGGYHSALSLSFAPRLQKNVFLYDGQGIGPLSGRSGTVVALSEGETMALLGVYTLTVLRGGISIMGTELYASSSSRSHTVFAPKCSPIPIIRALPSNVPSSFLLPDDTSRTFDANTTALFFEGIHTGVEGLGHICRTFEGAFETLSCCEDILNLSSASLMISITRSLQAFQLPGSWLNAFASLPPMPPEDNISDSLTLLVRGQKRTGKSTLARTLVNRLACRYQRVAYLECDLGQTEFTPPGLVSLNIIDNPVFGPPFTHPRLPYASHFIGSSSPKDSPSNYLAAISALQQTYKLELQHPAPEDQLCDSDFEDSRVMDLVPLVVNTMGWLKGLGADLSRQIEDLVEPTHIFATQAENTGRPEPLSRRNARLSDRNGWPSASPRIIDVEAISPNPHLARYTAADWRTLSTMSYFHSIPSLAQFDFLPAKTLPTSFHCDPRAPPCTWDCRLPLVAQVPFSVTPSEAIDSIVLIGPGAEDVVPSEVARVLNGAIVALVSCNTDLSESPSRATSATRLPYSQGGSPPDPSTSNCIGLALVRGVSHSLFTPKEDGPSNPEGDCLHILTPVPPALISATPARCFVKGEIELPVWGMLDHREFGRADLRTRENNGVPYLQWRKNDVIGGEKRRVRRNIMRREQL